MENNHDYISDEDLAAFLDGNLCEYDANRILSALDADNDVSEILSLSPLIDEEIRLEEKKGILPMSALAAANSRNLCSFDCEILILKHLNQDIDHWSLLGTAKANNWLREEGTPLHHVGRLLELKGMHVEKRYDASVGDIADALNKRKQVIAVISCPPAYHAIHVTDIKEDGGIIHLNPDTLLEESIDSLTFLKAWSGSGNYMVVASQTLAGYNPQPINVEDTDLDTDLEELTEAIAENAHDIWARARMDEGWTYGPIRDDAKKQHPDLVPYCRLPDSEKEYDRLMAMNTLRLVRRLGFDIVNHK